MNKKQEVFWQNIIKDRQLSNKNQDLLSNKMDFLEESKEDCYKTILFKNYKIILNQFKMESCLLSSGSSLL